MRIAMAIENHLGHRALMSNMREALAHEAGVEPVWIPINASGNGLLDHIPRLKDNHALVLALSAWRALRAAEAQGTVDVAFLHTQRMAHLLVPWMHRNPTFLSIDSTPATLEQYRDVQGLQSQKGSPYWSLRDAVHRRTYRAARGVICMSNVVRDAVVQSYGVKPEDALVLWPGVNVDTWHPVSDRRADGAVRLLFIGGDFERKGGPELLRWSVETEAKGWELDVVTEAQIQAAPHVRVHSGFKPNDPRLVALVQHADLLVLPTRADMSPWVVSEAKAAGTPVLSTRVGALGEMVREEVDGWLVPANDYAAFASRLDRAIGERSRLQEFRAQARADAELRFSARRNARLLLDFMRERWQQQRS